jgi:hypothetical protein
MGFGTGPDGSEKVRRRFGFGVLVGVVGTFLSGLLVALVVSVVAPEIKESVFPEPEPRPVQLERIRHDISMDGGEVLHSAEADLQGSGSMSQIFVTRYPKGPSELWIFDEDDGTLGQEFRFRPGPPPRRWATSEGRYEIEIASVSDLDADGAEEIVVLLQPVWDLKPGRGIAYMKRSSRNPSLLLGLSTPDSEVPVLVRRNHAERSYYVDPLIDRKPSYPIVPFSGPQRQARAGFYRRPYLISTPDSPERLRAYSAQAARVVRNQSDQPFLLTAYPARWGSGQGQPGFDYRPAARCPRAALCTYLILGYGRSARRPDVLSLVAGSIDTAARAPVTVCTAAAPYFIDAGEDPASAAKRAWPRLLLRSEC